MRNKSQFVPKLDRLEDRTCPALTLRQLPGVTILSGAPTADLTVTGIGGTSYQIKDGTKFLGNYKINSLQISLTSYAMPVTIDLTGQKLGGNILINRGNGNLAATDQILTITNGTVGGSITLTGGRGKEFVDLGVPAGGTTLKVGGNVTVVGRNGATGDGDDFHISAGSSVGGSVAVTTTPGVSIGEAGPLNGAMIGGNLTINNVLASKDAGMAINGGKTVIGGNVNIVGTNNFTVGGDFLTVETGATTNGNFVADLRDNLNLWLMGGTYNGNVAIRGGVGQPVGGSAANTIELDDGTTGATFNGSVTVNTLSSTSLAFIAGTTVAGDMTLNLLGNDENDIGAGGTFTGFINPPIFAGSVSGNVTARTGNGDNFLTLDAAAVVGGNLSYVSGNGTNAVTINSVGTGAVDLLFGSGDDSLTFGLGSQIGSLRARFGAGTDTYTDNGVTILGNVFISDLP